MGMLEEFYDLSGWELLNSDEAMIHNLFYPCHNDMVDQQREGSFRWTYVGEADHERQ